MKTGMTLSVVLFPLWLTSTHHEVEVGTNSVAELAKLLAWDTKCLNSFCENASCCQPSSGCHWTAATNLSERGSSRASTIPSELHAVATRFVPRFSTA